MKNLHNIVILDEYDRAIQWYIANKKLDKDHSYNLDNIKLQIINGKLYYTDIYEGTPNLARRRWSESVISQYRIANEKPS